MGCINDDGISTSVHQCLHTVEGVIGHTNTGSYAQTTFVILAGHRLVLGLRNILIGDQSDQVVVFIHHRQLLNLILLKDLGSSCQIGLLMGGHQVIF